MAQNKKSSRKRGFKRRLGEPHSFPGVSGNSTSAVRAPRGLRLDVAELGKVTKKQLRQQLRILNHKRDQMKSKFPSVPDLWTRVTTISQKRAADTIEQTEQLIRLINNELSRREEASHTTPRSEPVEAEPAGRAQTFSISEDNRSVWFRGTQHFLTANQGVIISMLYEAYLSGHLAVSKQRLLSAIGSQFSSVRHSFRGSPLWKNLVISPRRGAYALALPFPLGKEN